MVRKNLFGIALLSLALLVGQATWALAGTTGGLSGRLVLQDGTTPVAGAKVSVTAPSGSASSTTDSNGAFSFISLIPDTYTVTATKDGYDPVNQPGVTVFADNTQTVVLRTQRSKTLGPPIVVRGSAELVKPGTTSDVYSVNAATSAKLGSLGGGQNSDNAYSAIASIPGLYAPPGGQGWYQPVYIRGGDYDQVGYEVDGIPVNRAFDNYPSSTATNLGQQELQLYTGAAPANAESQGLAGFINQVIKVGTYPGFASLNAGIGIGAFYNKFAFEAGGATQSRNFSYYLGLGGYKTAGHVINQSDGADVSGLWGAPFDVQPCTPGGNSFGVDLHGNNTVPAGTDPTKLDCYQATQNYQNNALGGPGIFDIGPAGYILGPIKNNQLNFASTTDYETVVNLHFGLPHTRDAGKDDVQLLYESSLLRSPYFGSALDWGGSALFSQAAANGDSQTLSGGGVPWANNNPSGFPLLNAGYQYNGGPAGQVLSSCAAPCGIIRYGFPSSGTNATSLARFAAMPIVPPSERDTSENGQGLYKLQFQHNIGSTQYIRAYVYQFYSWWFLHGANSLNTAFVGCCPIDYELETHTRGASLAYANQLSAKHLLNIGVSGVTASTVRDNNTQTLTNLSGSRRRFAVKVDANNPYSGFCYSTGGSLRSCEPDSVNTGGRAQYKAYFDAASGGLPALPSNCGPTNNDPCAWLIGETGPYGTYNTVKPLFTEINITDQWKPNDKLVLNIGVRESNYQYKGADTNRGNISTFWFNAWNNEHCISAIPGSSPIDMVEDLLVTPGTNCTTIPDPTNPGHNYLPATITNEGAPTLSYNVVEPRFGGTYTFDPNNVIRFSFGKYSQAPNAAFEQYNTLQNNLPAFLGARFAAYGFRSPAHHVGPSVSYNYDVSFEHQFRGDTSMKLTPFYRKTRDQYQTFFLDQKTSFVSGLPIGNETSEGVEFQLNKGSFQRNGFSGQLSYTYTWAYVTYSPLSNGGTVLSSVNNAIRTYNAYTSFCASNPSDPRCGQTTGLSATKGAPCYTQSNPNLGVDPVPVACGTAGAVANPYWNAPVQNLFDPNAQYKPFSVFPNGFNSSVNSYLVPNVAALILNYKKDKWSFTPTFQYIGNGFYGAPLQSVGIDPVANQIPGNNFFASNPGEGGCHGVLGPAPTTANPSDPQYPYGAPGGNRYDAVTCGGGILIPDPYTGHFDGIGEFRSPAQILGNLQITYEATPKVTYTLAMNNIINTCFGGTTKPWTKYADRRVCNYGLPGYAPLNFRGNFTNPGVADQPIVQFPYQQYFGTQPFSAGFAVNVKL